MTEEIVSPEDIELKRKRAKHYIEKFFKDKSMYCGGSIPKSVLFRERNIKAVVDLDVCNGMDIIYKTIGSNYTEKELIVCEQKGRLPDDVVYVISKFRELARAGIPKYFSVGILLIYLELCEGYRLAA